MLIKTLLKDLGNIISGLTIKTNFTKYFSDFSFSYITSDFSIKSLSVFFQLVFIFSNDSWLLPQRTNIFKHLSISFNIHISITSCFYFLTHKDIPLLYSWPFSWLCNYLSKLQSIFLILLLAELHLRVESLRMILYSHLAHLPNFSKLINL